MAKDKNEKVRLAVAHNLSCSLNTLKRLTEDDNENIRYVAKHNIVKSKRKHVFHTSVNLEVIDLRRAGLNYVYPTGAFLRRIQHLSSTPN
ncbi:hypothetical protein CAL7716_094510 [Calothrix sp. PCC 7716]|nr:hypothetical protein CAL7716_094510 [Calothrix sp. PCC 7716]